MKRGAFSRWVGEPSPQLREVVSTETRRLRASRLLESRAYGRKLSSVAQLSTAAQEDELFHSSAGLAAVESLVGAVLEESTWVAARLMGLAETASHVPSVLDGLYSGRLTVRLADAVLRRCDLVLSEEVWHEVDERLARVLQAPGSWSVRRIETAVDKILAEVDPDAVRQDSPSAPRTESVDVVAAGADWQTLSTTLPATAVSVLDARLTQLAQTCCVNDPRPLSQRKAIALRQAVLGRMIVCACGRDDCEQPEEPLSPATVQLVVHAFASAETVQGTSDAAAVTADGTVHSAAALHRAMDDFETRVAPVAPESSAAQSANPYLPSAAARMVMGVRDLGCTFPGCNRRAFTGDLDHTREFCQDNPSAGGRTHPHNMKTLCRFHHRVKTASWWLDDQHSNGGPSIVFTAIDGTDYLGPAFDGSSIIPDLGDIRWREPRYPEPPPRKDLGSSLRNRLVAKHQRRQRERMANRQRREQRQR